MAAMPELAIKAYSYSSIPYIHHNTAPINRMIIVMFDNSVTLPISWGIDADVEHMAAKTDIININTYCSIYIIVYSVDLLLVMHKYCGINP